MKQSKSAMKQHIRDLQAILEAESQELVDMTEAARHYKFHLETTRKREGELQSRIEEIQKESDKHIKALSDSARECAMLRISVRKIIETGSYDATSDYSIVNYFAT